MVDVAVMTSNFRSVRGRPILCAILDEVAFLRDEKQQRTGRRSLYRAVAGHEHHPVGAAIRNLLAAREERYPLRKWKDDFGVDNDDILVLQAPRTF